MKKHRKRGRVVSVETEQIYGTKDVLALTLESSLVSNTVNTSFVERQNGTDRHLMHGRLVIHWSFQRRVYIMSVKVGLL